MLIRVIQDQTTIGPFFSEKKSKNHYRTNQNHYRTNGSDKSMDLDWFRAPLGAPRKFCAFVVLYIIFMKVWEHLEMCKQNYKSLETTTPPKSAPGYLKFSQVRPDPNHYTTIGQNHYRTYFLKENHYRTYRGLQWKPLQDIYPANYT